MTTMTLVERKISLATSASSESLSFDENVCYICTESVRKREENASSFHGNCTHGRNTHRKCLFKWLASSNDPSTPVQDFTCGMCRSPLSLSASDGYTVQVMCASKSLRLAAQDNDVESLEKAIKYDADVNGREESSGNTALHIAAACGHDFIAEVLMESTMRDVSLEERNLEERTPLHLAAIFNHLGVVDLLLQRRADVHTKDVNELTPLHYACNQGHTEVASMLIENGANIEEVTKLGNTPLLVAVIDGHSEIVGMLIDKGANVEATKGADEYNALHLAALYGHLDVVETLMKTGRFDIQGRTKVQLTAIHLAAYAGHVEMIRFLNVYIDLGVINEKGWTPLHFAAFKGHEDAVRHLIKQGADMNAATSSGQRPMDIAFQQGHETIVALLQKEGGDASGKFRRSSKPMTPYHFPTDKVEDWVSKLFTRRRSQRGHSMH